MANENEKPKKKKRNRSLSLGLSWKGRTGFFQSGEMLLDAGSYTITWSLIPESLESEEKPWFKGELLDADKALITRIPLDDESESVGYHTMTVNLPLTQNYYLQLQAKNVEWEIEILRLSRGVGS
ncbi:hypothetical protein [Paludifilum halophilum]|uniref:Uncharacterized protein n=1 Tax=Paludifilum halophilum TaxID=1642702 RepID=A0A235B5F5_9BACL|nr:hypothetical protein [Paludifilum halophilum]OYD07472.1 hypothetical protein CHM34_11265 [Paludifilum halophilum]